MLSFLSSRHLENTPHLALAEIVSISISPPGPASPHMEEGTRSKNLSSLTPLNNTSVDYSAKYTKGFDCPTRTPLIPEILKLLVIC